MTRRTRKMRLKEREPCVGAEKPDHFYDNFNVFVNNTSKSLENLAKSVDSTDDNNSLDTVSLNDKKTVLEKRADSKDFNKKTLEYYSFGATLSEPSSRSSSPSTINKESIDSVTKQ